MIFSEHLCSVLPKVSSKAVEEMPRAKDRRALLVTPVTLKTNLGFAGRTGEKRGAKKAGRNSAAKDTGREHSRNQTSGQAGAQPRAVRG